MNYYNSDVYSRPLEARVDLSAVMRQVYMWMFLGLMTTAGVAFFVGSQPALVMSIFRGPTALILVLVELGVVLFLATQVMKVSPTTAIVLFLGYSALNGLTLSVIFLAYQLGTIALAFVTTAATFGVVSIFAYTTKMDLSRMGNILFIALIGLIIASIVNMFFANSALFWIINYAGVLIFTGLTAWDTQKIKNMAMNVSINTSGDEAALVQRVSIIGALNLYLDFVNLFLYILRIMGSRR